MKGEKRVSSLEQEGRSLVERLGGRWTAQGGLCRCPAHDDRRPSLSVRPGRTRLLLHCFAGCDTADVLRALVSDRLFSPAAAAAPLENQSTSDMIAMKAAAIRLWRSACEVGGTPGAAYLEARGLTAGPRDLRFHPRVPHGRKPLTRFQPALIAAVRDSTGLVGVHRTFLRRRGSGVAAQAEAKCGLGPLGKGAVRLGRVEAHLGLAEGIETALSASALFGLPCWATLGTERFALVELPAEVTGLALFLDHDAGGRRAEGLAREAFAHRGSIEAYYPPRAGDDWNDVLREARRRAHR